MRHPTQTRILLLVEDNPADAELVKDMLESSIERMQYEIHHVSNLSAAEERLRERRIDVVLLDLRLPDASGLDGVKAILNIAQEIPIVVLTGMNDETLGHACIDAGAQDYLNKDELKPIALRRAIGYAITRLSEAQLRDVQSLLENYRSLSSHGTVTSVTAAMAGVGPIRDRLQSSFDRLLEGYGDLLAAYLDQIGYRQDKPRELMEMLVTNLGDLGAGPRDLLDIHVTALEVAVNGASVERARALVVEGRLLALELMGMLVDYYRVGNRRRFVAGDTR